VAGNWKLNMGPAEARRLAREVRDGLRRFDLAGDVLICPPYVSLPAAAELVKDSPLLLGAQNCASEASGAYTGEVAAGMLAETGCSHVIIAHSERRQYQHESDEEFIKKIDCAHAAGLVAIFCYGELIAERRAGRAAGVVRAQLEGVLPHVAALTAANTLLAYEPVWAIGTGETATPEIAQEIHALSRSLVVDLLGAELAAGLRILYGGSCKPSNARELLCQPDVDGGLIGGASLKAADFLGIVEAAQDVGV
jgi:triosephosphate isomerase